MPAKTTPAKDSRRAADVLLDTLLEWDVDTIFGLPGDGINGLMEALRTRQDRARPLLKTDDPLRRLEELYAIRDPLYREVADLVVDTGRQSVSALVGHLLKQLPEACRLSA